MAAEFTAIAALTDIPTGTCKAVSVGTIRLVVAHLADGFYAIENRCSHADSTLLTGKIYHGRQIACPIHGARFDLKTGAAKSPPAFTSLMMFPVRVVDGRIEVSVPPTKLG